MPGAFFLVDHGIDIALFVDQVMRADLRIGVGEFVENGLGRFHARVMHDNNLGLLPVALVEIRRSFVVVEFHIVFTNSATSFSNAAAPLAAISRVCEWLKTSSESPAPILVSIEQPTTFKPQCR